MTKLIQSSLPLLSIAFLVACGARVNRDAESAPPPPAEHAQSRGAEARATPAPASEPRLSEELRESEDAAGPPAAPLVRQSAPMPSKRSRAAPNQGALVQLSPAPPLPPATTPHNTEAYDAITENGFLSVSTKPLSTFSVDVDTASYSNVRRFLLQQGSAPPKGAVRIEELVNYFDYDYPQPQGSAPFSVSTEVSAAPWKPEHRLVHIGLQGKELAPSEIPGRNLVFLLDVSGSMSAPNKLPLLKRSFSALLGTLNSEDRVAIVVYAGASGLVLPSTRASERATIMGALDRLSAGGSTNGGAGIRLAYDVARQQMRRGGVNRVILATDGDFNVGQTSRSDLSDLIEEERKSGVFLTVLGFGMGNYQDPTLEQLADKGNGNYAYIDSFREAQKVLVEEANSTLVTIAKDVKIQVEFNPAVVGAYRLIGYENRRLNDEDFNDDKKDAGEIGAGHTVTALYEIASPSQAAALTNVDRLSYQTPKQNAGGEEILTVKLRYKAPAGSRSRLLRVPVKNRTLSKARTSENFRFSAAVAAFGMLLRSSPHAGAASFAAVEQWARAATGNDRHGYRGEFLSLVSAARRHGSTQAIAR